MTEIAVLSPVKQGRVKGERQTYEQRARGVVNSIQQRVKAGIPQVLAKVPSIHFGRIIFLRPEQYMDTAGLGSDQQPEETKAHRFPSHLLTLVEFDGDLKAYFRDIKTIVGPEFDMVFENCENFPGAGNFEKFWLWIRRYQIPVSLFLSPHSNLSVQKIKQLEEFKRRFDEFTVTMRGSPDWPGDLEAQLDRFLLNNQQHAANFPTTGGVYKPNP